MLIPLLICLQTGCENARELNDLVVVMGVGLDEDAQKPQNIKLIAQIVLPNNIGAGSSSGEGGGSASSEKPFCNIESSAENSFDAIREFTHIVCNKLYLAHNQVFVISKAIARRGIMQYMDFFVRAKETRPTTLIVIADQTAAEILGVEPKMCLMAAINIMQLIPQQANNSQSMEATVLDYLNAMHSDTAAFLAPMIFLKHQEDETFLSVKGLAVFVKDKMVGELNADETRGLLWVLGKVKSGAMNVTVAGQKVSVDIVSCKTKLTSEIQDGNIIMSIDIDQKGTLALQSGSENLVTDDAFSQIETEVERSIREEIMLAFEKAKALGADVFDFGETLHKYHLEQWQTMHANWAEIFPTIELDIRIKSTIVGAGILTNSAEGRD